MGYYDWTAMKPTIIIKCINEGRYAWYLYLSNNKKRPTCISPTTYKTAFKCRERARQFAKKFNGPLRLLDPMNRFEEMVIVDTTKKVKLDDTTTANGNSTDINTETLPT